MKAATIGQEERMSSGGWLLAAPFAVLLLTAANGFLTWKIDYLIARASGAITTKDTGWTQFSTPDWMFASLLGPALVLSPILFFVLLATSGCAAAWILLQSARERRICRSWLPWVLVALLWVLRVPLPGAWTIFYFTAVAY